MPCSRIVPIVTVPDVAAAATAYEQVLGLETIMDHGWIRTLGDPADPGGPQLSLMDRDATAAVNPQVSIQTDDVDSAYAAALAAGVPIVHELTDEEWGVRRFFFTDAAGTVINVLSHRG